MEKLHNIDAIKINFDQGNLDVLNVLLAILMFSVALDVNFSDFRKILRRPKLLVVGLTSQLLVLPLLTIVLIFILNPPASIALGMILVAVCPGGNISNYAVNLARGNTALSVSLTSFVTISASVITPLGFFLWSKFVNVDSISDIELYIDPFEMIRIVLLLIILPIAIGLFLKSYYPKFVSKIDRPIRIVSLVIFISFIFGAMAANFENIKMYVGGIFIFVFIHNLLAMVAGFYFSKLNKLSLIDSRTISIETGIQNTGLGLILVFKFFDGLGGMALMAAWYGIWDMIVVLVVALWWSKHNSILSIDN